MARPKPRGPAKLDALRQTGTLHPHPQLVTDPLFLDQPFFDARDLMQVKYELFRKVEVDGAPVSSAVTAFGLSRPSYYQARSAFEQGGLAGLAPQNRGPRRAQKFSAEVMAFLDQLRGEQPEIRYQEMAERVQQRFGIAVNPRSVERHLRRGEKKRVEPGRVYCKSRAALHLENVALRHQLGVLRRSVRQSKQTPRDRLLSALGFGCMGKSYHRGIHPGREQMIRLLRHAVDLGVTFFDTAETYGQYRGAVSQGRASRNC
jgi:transposase